MILPIQCRMARTALNMDIAELARLANLSTNTVVRFERGEQLKLATVEQIQKALEGAGVVFIPENGGGAGVRFTTPRARAITKP
jgi:transcriptional regulator with XRE-family HTH domain